MKLPKTWRFDATAGITVAIVALPLALAFGVTSGAGAAAGLATAIVAGFVAAIFGGSRYQVSGPTGAMTVILVPIIATHGTSALFALGILSGGMILLMSLLRLGRFVEQIPWSVMEGFTLGIALVIALQQVPLIFEVPRAQGTDALLVFYETVRFALSNPINWLSIGLVVLTLLIKVAWNRAQTRFFPQARVPAGAVGVLLVSILVWAMGLNVAKIGALPANAIFSLNLDFESVLVLGLVAPAASIALLGAIESLLAARVADSMAHRRDQEPGEKHNPNRELLGQGLATMASAISGGMPATGAIARTGVNVQSGAKSRFASALHALALLAMVLFLTPLVTQIPMSALAAVLLATSWRIASPASIREALSTSMADRASFLGTATAVLATDLIVGLVIGIAIHLLLRKTRWAKSTGSK